MSQCAAWQIQRGPRTTAWDQLEVEVTDPVDYVEKQERGGEEDPGVGIQLPDVDVDPTFPPAAFFTLLIAAEKACAVFPVQALVQAVVLVIVPEQGVTHGHHGPRGVNHVEGRVRLNVQRKKAWFRNRSFTDWQGKLSFTVWKGPVPFLIFYPWPLTLHPTSSEHPTPKHERAKRRQREEVKV